ncbi:MAG: hypothetical protein AAGC64_12780 [Bacteroidota bacterium]
MKNIQFPIVISTILVCGFALGSGLEINYKVLGMFFIVVHVSFFWMIYSILKNGEPTNKSFDDYFYEDREDIKRS